MSKEELQAVVAEQLELVSKQVADELIEIARSGKFVTVTRD